MRRIATIGAAALAALALGLPFAGCGDDDGDEPTAAGDTVPENLSKSEYLEAGDRICAEGTAEIARQALERYGEAQPTLDQVDEFATEIVAPVLQEQVDSLRDLPPPGDDAERVSEIYDAVDEGIAELREDPSLLSEPGTGGAFDRANRLAQGYGFSQCGSA